MLTVEVGLSEVNANKIREIGAQLSRQISELSELLTDLTNLETALNNAEMSISTARISKEVTDLEQVTQSEKQTLGKLDLWCDYFQTIREELERVRSQALARYIESYLRISD